MLIRKTPLAWLQLTHQRGRLVIATLGIAFALLLVFVQLGLQGALYESNTVLQSHLRGDLVMVDTQATALITLSGFSRRRLYQALAVEGVDSVTPIYFEYHTLENIDESLTRDLAIYGINPNNSPFDFPDLDRNLHRLRLSDTVLFDRGSIAEFGTITERLDAGQSVRTELAGHRINLAAAIDFIGTSFAFDGNVVTSDYTLFRIFPNITPEIVSIGVITLTDNADPQTVLTQIQQQLPSDIKVVTRQQYVELEKDHWRKTTPIGFVFSMGVIVGLMVGVIIVYQILYAEISDHVPDYALLKARGYRSRYFLSLVLQESFLLAIAGYIPGFLLSSILYKGIAAATSLPLYMTLERALWVFVLTIVMCMISGGIAIRKLGEADPAELF
ncbi:MAG: ABC transporter permease DevC [Cyanobacteria bacterium P01_F01_bin.86]